MALGSSGFTPSAAAVNGCASDDEQDDKRRLHNRPTRARCHCHRRTALRSTSSRRPTTPMTTLITAYRPSHTTRQASSQQRRHCSSYSGRPWAWRWSGAFQGAGKAKRVTGDPSVARSHFRARPATVDRAGPTRVPPCRARRHFCWSSKAGPRSRPATHSPRPLVRASCGSRLSPLTGQFIGRVLRDARQRAAVKRDDPQAQRPHGAPATRRSRS